MGSEDAATNDGASVELSLDDLEGAAGGGAPHLPGLKIIRAEQQAKKSDRMVFCVDCGATYMESQGHDCPEQ